MLLARIVISFGLLNGIFFVLASSSAIAQNQSEKVAFETVDEVELQGTYYPSNQGMKAPCVLMLHDLSGNGSGTIWSEWTSLTTKLQKNGFAVLEDRPMGLFYSGTLLFGSALPIARRRALSRVLGSATHVYKVVVRSDAD